MGRKKKDKNSFGFGDLLIIFMIVIGIACAGYLVGDFVVEWGGNKEVLRVGEVIGEYYFEDFDCGYTYWAWRKFRLDDVKERHDGFTKIGYEWVKDDKVLFYADQPDIYQKKRDEIEALGPEEVTEYGQ